MTQAKLALFSIAAVLDDEKVSEYVVRHVYRVLEDKCDVDTAMQCVMQSYIHQKGVNTQTDHLAEMTTGKPAVHPLATHRWIGEDKYKCL